MTDVEDILKRVQDGSLPLDQAARALTSQREVDLGFARIDTDRVRRRGLPEVIYCPGKTSEQVVGIARSMREAGQNVFGTRVSQEQIDALLKEESAVKHHEAARAFTLDVSPLPPPHGLVTIVCAGTSDIPVAEEAALTAERMGARVERVFDVGVAGLHRLMHRVDLLRSARAVVVVAGMEGALPSVVGGLIDRPVIAVPTSIGYGVHLGGIAPLLAMLNSCVPGVTVVNIDNGFGAGVAAAMINRTDAS